MKTCCTLISMAAIFCLFSCQADPGVITDDDAVPTIPIPPTLECDSLLAPNNVFPNKIGEHLVFTDSSAQVFDTLLCSKNKAYSEKVIADKLAYCLETYEAAYSSNWLPKPDVYSFEIKIVNSISTTRSVQSTPQEDFFAVWNGSGTNESNAMDSLTVNGKLYKDVVIYNCLSSKPCLFLEAVVTAKDAGLVAYKRNATWWTKI